MKWDPYARWVALRLGPAGAVRDTRADSPAPANFDRGG